MWLLEKRFIMNSLWLHDKKAVSEMVSYAVLIIIAIGLSVLVYAYLQVYVPKEKATCPSDVALIVQEYTCTASKTIGQANLTLTLLNKGFFTLDTVYLRVGPEERRIKELINDPNSAVSSSAIAYDNFYLFWIDENNTKRQGLPPGKTYQRTYHPKLNQSGTYGLEVQPALLRKGKLVLCERAVTTQTLSCS